MDPDAYTALCEGYEDEMRRIHQEHVGKLGAARREITKLDRRSNEIKNLLLCGFSDDLWKQALQKIRNRRDELHRLIAAAEGQMHFPR